MLVQLSLGTVLVVVSTVLHIVALDLINRYVRAVVARHAVPLRTRVRIPLLVFTAMATFVSQVAQIWLWGAVYLATGEFNEFEPALYFSAVVFTTLGFGDLVVSPDWRLFASCEAAEGLLVFGLSTAFLFEALYEIMRRRRS